MGSGLDDIGATIGRLSAEMPDLSHIVPINPAHETNDLLRQMKGRYEATLAEVRQARADDAARFEQERAEGAAQTKRERKLFAVGLAVSFAFGIPGWIALFA